MSGFKTLFITGITLCCFAAVDVQVSAQLHEAFLPQQENVVRDQCLMNQRVLIGAIEMYNMDHSEGINSIDDKTLQESGPLVSGYLKNPLQIMPGCALTSSGDLMQDGYILCSIHGSSARLDRDAQELEDFKNAAKKLMDKGATVDGPDANGDTTLQMAVELESPMVVEYLLSLKADPALKNSKGKNALDIAIDNQDLRTARILQSHGAIPGIANSQPGGKAVFHPKFTVADGNVQIITEKQTQPLDINATCTLPLSLKTQADGHVSFSVGRDENFYTSPDTADFEKLLGNGLTIEMPGNSELLVDQPEFDKNVAIVTAQPMRLVNGEMRISSSGAAGKTGTPVIYLGRQIILKCQSGTYKIVYDAARDAGKIVVKIGTLEAIAGDAAAKGVEITGFYQLSFENGKLGEPQQANISEEFE